jgi:hypothetical protein
MPAALDGALAPHCHNPEKIPDRTSVARKTHTADANPHQLKQQQVNKTHCTRSRIVNIE